MLNEKVALDAIDLNVNASSVFAIVYFQWGVEYSTSTLTQFL
jgi:hypothetical protein